MVGHWLSYDVRRCDKTKQFYESKNYARGRTDIYLGKNYSAEGTFVLGIPVSSVKNGG